MRAAAVDVELAPRPSGGLGCEVERSEVDPLAVVRVVRAALPELGRVVLGTGTLQGLAAEGRLEESGVVRMTR